MGEIEGAAGEVFVGNGIAVGSITGAGAQAVSRKKAATMRFFIEGNYMSVHVIARRSDDEAIPCYTEGLGLERTLLKRRLLRRFAARNDTNS